MASQLIPLSPGLETWKSQLSRAIPKTGLLRLSVTDRCNFRCRYCMPAEGIPKFSHHELLPLEQLAEMVRWLSMQTPIERVKITGGEPLVRRGLEQLVSELCEMPNVREVSLTTNGTLLAGKVRELKARGLARVSVSLDSLDAGRFSELSRGGQLCDALAGIDAALEAGLTPVKLNTVLQRSSWEADVPALLDFASQRGLQPRFIELMRIGTERAWCDSEFVSTDRVREWLESETTSIPIPMPAGSPGRLSRVLWRNNWVTVGWISPRSHPFCGACERIRLDSMGRLRRCLMDPTVLDLASLRRDAGNATARETLHQYLANKRAPDEMDSEHRMSQIGG